MSLKEETDAVRQGVRQRFNDVYDVLGDLSKSRDTTVGRSTSTGVVSLDAALGGRLPSGAIEIYGEASTGKTSLLYEIIATAQKSGHVVALCPSEYLDIPYMKEIGIDLNSLVLITGNYGDYVLEAALNCLYIHSNVPMVLALDSATSLRPEDDEPGNWMRMIDLFLKQALEGLHHTSCVVMVNQVRMKRSVDPTKFFVDGEVTTTARKILDLFSLRLELSRGESRDGNREMEVNIVESVVSKPATVLRIPVSPYGGIDTMKDLLQYAVALDVVSKHGAWYVLNTDGARLGGGIEDTLDRLEKEPELASRLLDQVMMKA